MSSPKPFEKTFSRKNKPTKDTKKKITPRDEDNLIDDHQVLLLALAAKSPTSNGQPSQTPKKPRHNKPTKETKKPKAETQKRKLKSEQNGDEGSNKKKKKKKNVKVDNGDGDDNKQALKNKEKKNNGMPTKRKIKKSDKVGKEREEKENSECAFPTARVARIIKSEGSDYRLSSEAIFLINKATEKFIGLFSNDAYDLSVQEGKSYVGYKHLATTVSQEKRFDFLSDFIPEKLTAEKAMAERKPVEKSPT